MNETTYALAKQIPNLHGASSSRVATAYGDIELNREETEKLAVFLERMLQRRLKKEQKNGDQ